MDTSGRSLCSKAFWDRRIQDFQAELRIFTVYKTQFMTKVFNEFDCFFLSFSANPAYLGRVCLLQFSPESHIDHVELQNFLPCLIIFFKNMYSILRSSSKNLPQICFCSHKLYSVKCPSFFCFDIFVDFSTIARKKKCVYAY